MPTLENDSTAMDSVTSEGDESQGEVLSLRYIDYICGHRNMAPIIKAVEKQIGIPIELIEAPHDVSGPR